MKYCTLEEDFLIIFLDTLLKHVLAVFYRGEGVAPLGNPPPPQKKKTVCVCVYIYICLRLGRR